MKRREQCQLQDARRESAGLELADEASVSAAERGEGFVDQPPGGLVDVMVTEDAEARVGNLVSHLTHAIEQAAGHSCRFTPAHQ
ncbi:hypothetical protein ACFCWG_43950 [Streptomyces sp. NPDC056390]|uniref:hypothetical protein n=1 Tax=Streptomyces sp. NPDC056390 TaxID=3345806 RepID=UPI0035E31A7E